MQEKTRGIVLRSIRYNEQSMIVDIYTEKNGNVSFMVKVPRSKKSSLRTVLFRPLTILSLDFEMRPNKSFQKISDVRPDYVYTSLPYHPYKSAMALFLSEFLYKVLRNESANVSLFSYLDYSLQWLDSREKDFSNFHLVFITRLTRFLGFYPNVEDYIEGDYFDMQNACFVHERPFHKNFLSPEEAKAVPMFMRMSFYSMRFFSINRRMRIRYIEVLNDYYRLHIPDFPELKSLDVLKEIFT